MRRVGLILASVALALALAELVLRAVWEPPSLRSTPAFGPHPDYGWAPRPGAAGVTATAEYEHTFRHTARGFRGDVEFGHVPGDGIDGRVLFLGDSFTYGIGVDNEETFVALLDAAWRRVEVANGGVNGYGTREALHVLHRFGAEFRPDVTVLVFFWNDLEDNLRRDAPEFRVDGGGRVALLRAGIAPRARRAPRLYLRLLVREGWRGWRYRTMGIRPRFIRSAGQARLGWLVTERLLRLMAIRAAELGSRLLVTSVPDHNQIDPAARIRNIEPLHYEIQDRLAEVCARVGVPCLDVREDMATIFRESGERLYYYADRHLTAAGHRAFARALRRKLGRVVPGS